MNKTQQQMLLLPLNLKSNTWGDSTGDSIHGSLVILSLSQVITVPCVKVAGW